MATVEGREKKNLIADKKNGLGECPQLWQCTTQKDEFSFIKEQITKLIKSTSLPSNNLKNIGILFRKNAGFQDYSPGDTFVKFLRKILSW